MSLFYDESEPQERAYYFDASGNYGPDDCATFICRSSRRQLGDHRVRSFFPQDFWEPLLDVIQVDPGQWGAERFVAEDFSNPARVGGRGMRRGGDVVAETRRQLRKEKLGVVWHRFVNCYTNDDPKEVQDFAVCVWGEFQEAINAAITKTEMKSLASNALTKLDVEVEVHRKAYWRNHDLIGIGAHEAVFNQDQ